MYSVVQILSFTPFFKVISQHKIHTGHFSDSVQCGRETVAVVTEYVISMWKQNNENGKVNCLYMIYYLTLNENVFT
jgi:hypothetical protein